MFWCACASFAAWAGDDLPVTLVEEDAVARAEAAPRPQAANIDLKEPVDQPFPPPREAEESNTATAPPPAPPPVEPATAPAQVNEPPPEVPFEILGVEIPRSTSSRLAWSPAESFAGIAVPTPVLVVRGRGDGPKVCLTAALHGDELNGIEIVRRIMYDLAPESLNGTVIGVPIVNLQGFRRASRYLPDRRDLNRYFPGRAEGSSASRIAHSFFNEIIRHCDFLVDLHTGSFRRTNLPQLRADLKNPAVAELVQNMGAIVVLQSKGARGSLRRAAVDAGIPAVTVEAGEPLNVQMDAVEQGAKSIETLLHKLNMYPQRGIWARKTEPVYYKSRWVRANAGGILISTIKLGERVKQGDVLGTVTDPITNHKSDIAAPLNGRIIGMALNQIMMPGFAAYHIGYQTTAEDAAQLDAGPEDAGGDDAANTGPVGQSNEVTAPSAEAAE